MQSKSEATRVHLRINNLACYQLLHRHLLWPLATIMTASTEGKSHID